MRVSRTLSSTDISRYYRQNSSARLANVDTAAVCGNLAFAMKNATIVLQAVHCADLFLIDSLHTIELGEDEDRLEEIDSSNAQ